MAYSKPQSRRPANSAALQSSYRVTGMAVLFLCVGFGIWLSIRYSNSIASDWALRNPSVAPEVAARKSQPGLVLPDSLGDLAMPAPGNSDPHRPIAKSNFSLAYARLEHALQAHGSEPGSELANRLLAAANTKHACPITWSGGGPSLLLGNKEGSGLALPDALNRCASAIEQLP